MRSVYYRVLCWPVCTWGLSIAQPLFRCRVCYQSRRQGYCFLLVTICFVFLFFFVRGIFDCCQLHFILHSYCFHYYHSYYNYHLALTTFTHTFFFISVSLVFIIHCYPLIIRPPIAVDNFFCLLLYILPLQYKDIFHNSFSSVDLFFPSS